MFETEASEVNDDHETDTGDNAQVENPLSVVRPPYDRDSRCRHKN